MASATPEFDLVMLDLGLPGCSGVQALERFRELFPALPVVVISGSNEMGNISAALEIGAMGYIPKSYPRDVLLNAVRLVVSGGIYVPVEALKARGEEASADATSRPAARGRTMLSELGLSPRQSEVLSLLLKGLPNKLIARKLDISENTTKIHVSAVLHALGVSTRTQALIAANRLGLRLDGA
jgi:DNA-binding NarL/FixJ family response regulator